MFLGSGWVSDEFKSRDIFRLRKKDKNGTDPMEGWRCLKLLNHSGKAFTRRAKDPCEQELVETTSRTQFVETTVTESHAKWRDMYTRLPRGTQKAHRMISFFVDLSKAFDLTPRAALWRYRREKCRKRRHAVAMEQIHNSNCFFARDEGTARVVTRIPTRQGVRQSSVREARKSTRI